MGIPDISEIKTDKFKREQYLDGYLHGTSGIKKNLPTYEIESYELGYRHGSEGKIKKYFEVSEFDGPKKEAKSLTRQKKKKRKC